MKGKSLMLSDDNNASTLKLLRKGAAPPSCAGRLCQASVHLSVLVWITWIPISDLELMLDCLSLEETQ